MSAKFISGEKSSRSANVVSGISDEAAELSLSGSAAALSAVVSAVFSAADEAVEANDSDEAALVFDEAAVSEDVVVILAVVPLADETEELVDEAEEVEADVSAVVFACFSFTEQPAEISIHNAKIKEILRFMVCVPFPTWFKTSLYIKLENHEKSCSFW